MGPLETTRGRTVVRPHGEVQHGVFGRREYGSFAELSLHEQEDRDWRRVVAVRDSDVAILAPHGGAIESGTSEIAREIAEPDFCLYCFEALRARGNQRLHIASSLFDDPECLALLARARIVVAIHGCDSSAPYVALGGLHLALRERLGASLAQAGFPVVAATERQAGVNRANICNRGATGQGAQLEISRGLRKTLFVGLGRWERRWATPALLEFVAAVRAAILATPESSA